MSRFEDVRALGAGRSGLVRAARDRARGGARVVLKAAPPGAPGEAEREFRVLSHVRHPALARALDLVELDGAPTVVLDFVPGETLEEFVRRGGRVDGAGGRAVAVALLAALDRLHAEGFLHLDVKPANVVVRSRGERLHAVLVDAGLALDRTSATVAGRAGGTARFAAPEVLAGDVVDVRADLFSLGRTLREAVDLAGDPGLVAVVDRLDAERIDARFPTAAEALASRELARSHEAWRQGTLVPLPWIRRPPIDERTFERIARSGVVELIGPAGSGRTAFLERLHRAARLSGRPALLVRGASGEDLAGRLAAAWGVDAPPPEEAPHFGDGGRPAFHRTLKALRPLPGDAILLVDDADRLEADVLSALTAAARGRDVADGGLLLATSRPLDVGAASLELPPIAVDDLAVALPRLSTARLDPRFVRRVATKVCEGRRGLVRGVVESFATGLRRAPSVFEALRAIDRGAVPAAPRLGRTALADLTPTERTLTEVLAVAGEPLPEPVLIAVGGDAADVHEALAALRERGAVLGQADGCRELHPRLLAALRGRIDRRTTRRVAAPLIAASVSPERELYAFLASPDTETDRALAEILDKLREHGAPRRALDCAQRACEAAPEAALSCSVVVGRALVDRGRLREAERQLEASRRVAGERGGLAAAVTLGQAELAQARGALDDARRLAAQAFAQADDGRTRSRAFNLEGLALYRAGAYEEVLRRTGEPAGVDEGDVGSALRSNLAGIASLRLGRLDEAARELGEALACFDRIGSASGVAMVRNNLALVESRRGRPARAVRQLLSLRRDAARADAPIRLALAANNAALLFRDAGRLERARRLLDEAVELRRSVGERYGLAASLANRATVLSELGEATEALRDVDEALESFRSAGAPAKELIVLKNRVRVLAALGDEAAFARAAGEAGVRVRAAGAPLEEGDVSRFEALVLARRGDVAAAVEKLHDAAGRYVEAGDRSRETDALVERALLAAVAPPPDDERGALAATLRRRQEDEPSRERRGMLALGLSRLGVAGAEGFVLDAFSLLQRSARPRWRQLAAAAAADVAARRGRSIALDRALAVGMEALAVLRRGAPGHVDPSAEERLLALTAGRDDAGRARLAGPAGRAGGERTADVHSILDLYHRLAETSDVEPLLDAILDAALALSGASRALLLVREGDDQAVVLRARDDDAAPLEEPEAQYSRAILETVLGSGRPVVLGDAALDSRWSGHLSVRRLRLRSVACVPLRVKGVTLGALYVDQSGRSRAFDPDRLALLERLADQASLALERVRNETKIRSLNRELEQKLARVERALGAERRASGVAGALRPVMRFAGSHPSIARIRTELERAAVTDLPVLVTGETGTGKGLAARCLHDASPRAGGPFVVLEGAAIPESLFEAEVFGAVEGAFTGAAERAGIVGEADGGTLLLDEVESLSAAAQAKLLRFLESGEIRPVGGRPRRVDVRIVAAASDELLARVESGAFREDLFWRLKGIAIGLPPLRERGEDVLELAELFLAESGADERTLKLQVRQRLLRHPWRGNIHELRHEMLRLAARGRGPITVSDLAPGLRGFQTEVDSDAGAGGSGAVDPRGAREERRRTETDLVRRALSQTGGNRTHAARLLGMSRYGLLKKLKRLGLEE